MRAHRASVRPLPALLLAVAAALTGACGAKNAPMLAHEHAGRTPEFSGFLRDYSALRASPRHPDALYEQSPDLARYSSFIVEPIAFLPTHTAGGAPIERGTAERLAAELRDEVVQSLRLTASVVGHPGPGVARIRAAVTGISRTRTDPATGRTLLGGASVEVEILDSLTDRRLAAAVEADTVDPMHEADPDPFYDARLVFRHWAARLNLWLSGARSGDVPSTH